jgi:hypothetical protein
MSKVKFKFEIGESVIMPDNRQGTITERWWDRTSKEIEIRYTVKTRTGLWVFLETSLKGIKK